MHRPALIAVSVLLAISGAADSVIMIYRNTMLQASEPDAMRGPAGPVHVTGGPRIGER